VIRFSAIVSVVAVAIGMLAVGAISGILLLVYVSIALAALALLMLIAGVIIWRDEVFGRSASSVSAGARPARDEPAVAGSVTASSLVGSTALRHDPRPSAADRRRTGAEAPTRRPAEDWPPRRSWSPQPERGAAERGPAERGPAAGSPIDRGTAERAPAARSTGQDTRGAGRRDGGGRRAADDPLAATSGRPGSAGQPPQAAGRQQGTPRPAEWPAPARPERGRPSPAQRGQGTAATSRTTAGQPPDQAPQRAPSKTPSAEAAPAEPASAEPASAEPASAEPASAEQPAAAASASAEPSAAAGSAGSAPAGAKRADALPADARPADALPADARPADALPAEAGRPGGASAEGGQNAAADSAAHERSEQSGRQAVSGSNGHSQPLGGQVSVVPGIARYHMADCILIRFLGEDDLEIMSPQAAEATGCVPCRACRPEKALAEG
jgi:hypothetical protein